MGGKNIFPPDFTINLGYSEVQKKNKMVNILIRFQEERILF